MVRDVRLLVIVSLDELFGRRLFVHCGLQQRRKSPENSQNGRSGEQATDGRPLPEDTGGQGAEEEGGEEGVAPQYLSVSERGLCPPQLGAVNTHQGLEEHSFQGWGEDREKEALGGGRGGGGGVQGEQVGKRRVPGSILDPGPLSPGALTTDQLFQMPSMLAKQESLGSAKCMVLC